MKLLSAGAALLAAALAAAFIALTSVSLPPLVASHFAAGGSANGFMPRSGYVALMLFVSVGVPLLLVSLSFVFRLIPARLINLPNRDYWLAPERRAATLAYLQGHGSFFAVLLTIFLCFVHWLVVRANAAQPPHFPEHVFFVGLSLFLVGVAAWLGAFVLHFSGRR